MKPWAKKGLLNPGKPANPEKGVFQLKPGLKVGLTFWNPGTWLSPEKALNPLKPWLKALEPNGLKGVFQFQLVLNGVFQLEPKGELLKLKPWLNARAKLLYPAALPDAVPQPRSIPCKTVHA